MKKMVVAMAFGTLAAFTQIQGAQAADAWIVKDSASSVPDTVAKLTAAVEGAGAKVFAVVDHAAGATSIGTEIPAVTMVMFGNPKIGTPIIAADPKAGVDLPIRVLVWDESGKTKIGYPDPSVLQTRYSLDGADDALKTMTGALDKLTGAAAQ